MWRNTAGLARRRDHADELRQVRQQLRRLRDHALRLVGLQLLAHAGELGAQLRFQRPRRQHRVDEQAVAARAWARGRPRCAGWRSGRAPRGRPSRCGWWPATAPARMLATACASRPAGRRRCSARPASSAATGRARPWRFSLYGPCSKPACEKKRCGVIRRMGSRFRHAALVRQTPGRGHTAGAGGDRAPFWRSRAARCSLERQTARTTGICVARRTRPRRDRRARATSPWWWAATAPMLGVARQLARHDVPLVGINQGRLGFITDVPVGQVREALEPLVAGDYEEEHRAMLEGEVWRDGATSIFEGLVDERRGGQPRRHRRHGGAAHRHRRGVRRQPARRRPDHRLAHRQHRLCAVGRRPDPAPGHRGLGAGADRLARLSNRPIVLPDAGESRASASWPVATRRPISTCRASPACSTATRSACAARRTACASCTRAAGATSPRCAASCAGTKAWCLTMCFAC